MSICIDYLDSLEKQTTYTLAVRLSFCLGARIGELRALHWEDYDRESRTIFIHRQMCDEPAGNRNRVATEKTHMKGRNNRAGKRRIALSDYAVSILSELYKINGDNHTLRKK
ncbi:MAG: tyrosine-type recombinase/integrase [Eubacteriales bacterium]|nr:tyrosine-type recombinase/integrase [Eubacteriales bacterium]